jgi:hypothetical protein
MRRRNFLHISLASMLADKLCFSFGTTAGALLKVGDSDTPIFPYRGGEHGWWGYVDAEGRVLISADSSHIADRLFDFYAGLGAVRFDDGSEWMIDTKGLKQFAIYPNSYDWNYVMRDGLLPNRHRTSGKWGYVNRAGQWVITAHFEFAYPFSQERAVVAVGELRGVIDRKGSWIVRPSPLWAIEYRNGLLCIEQKKRFAYLDLNGRHVFGRDFEHATPFRSGFAVVHQANKAGVIDASGRMVMPFQYDAVWLGSDSTSPMLVKQNGVWMIVNEGKTILLPASTTPEPFSCGRSIVQDDPNGSGHFIGIDGTKLFGTSYWRPEQFVLDRTAVQTKQWGEHTWIDREGRAIFRWNGP